MKKLYLQSLFVLALTFGSLSLAQNQPGAPPDIKNNIFTQTESIFNVSKTSSMDYSTTVFTFGDITIFSYFDGTTVSVSNSSGTVVGSATIKADTLFSLSPGQGIYSISGDKPYSVLIGDAISSYVNGYFALDQSGRGSSTKLNTWMMNGSSISSYDPHFIIFSYNDSTDYTIKNLQTGSFVYAGSLNKGGYLDFPDITSIEGKSLQITSNKPVSALSYTDQDYYVPSANGTFAGKLFYGFSGHAGGWTNSITITSYADNNQITVTNLESNTVLKTTTLGLWQVTIIPVTQDTFWKIESSETITAANIPYAGYSGSYYYMARTADSTGSNIGSSYIMPSIASTISIFSYDDNNRLNITLLGDTTYPYTSPSQIADTLLQKGKSYIFSSASGNKVYRITADKHISILQSNGGAGADFMPLGYALNLPDLAISQSDINFSPGENTFSVSDKINIDVTIHNYGTTSASDILVSLYDGDPDLGAMVPIGSSTISSIAANGTINISIPYIVPINPQYHYIFVKIDPSDGIAESNESNNKSSRPLISNSDLLPPLSVNVITPTSLSFDPNTNLLSPNPFTVSADFFNTGNVAANNVRIIMTVKNGLALTTGASDTTIASVAASGTVHKEWTITANKDSSGINLYTINVSASNATPKDVNRAVIVMDNIVPVAPTGLSSSISQSKVTLNWNSNTEKDLGGYKIYYGTDGVNWTGTGATEGTSPITISTLNQFTLNGLTVGTTYHFHIKAFDLSGNLSNASNTVSISVTDIKEIKSNIPTNYNLYQNYPNPFNPATLIRFNLPYESKIRLIVYNMLGQEIRELVNSVTPAGTYEVLFNAGNLSSGVYYYKITAISTNDNKQFIDVKKLILIK